MSIKRPDIVQTHMDEGNNILPNERKPFCLIPNNFPFRAGTDEVVQSLHALLTTHKFYFEDLDELSDQQYTLYSQVHLFCHILYKAHKYLHNEYSTMRIGTLIDKATFPEFHEHRYFVENKATLSGITSKTLRSRLDNQGIKMVVGSLQQTRDILLNENPTNTGDEVLNTMRTKALECKQKIIELLLLTSGK